MGDEFSIKDSGQRTQFEGGMVRDTTEGKINFLLIRPGPMFRRWAAHLSRAAAKYDNTRNPGEPRNWQLAEGMAEYERFQESAARHFESWLDGEDDEDHAAGVFFNINGAEYVKAKLKEHSVPDLDWCLSSLADHAMESGREIGAFIEARRAVNLAVDRLDDD